ARIKILTKWVARYKKCPSSVNNYTATPGPRSPGRPAGTAKDKANPAVLECSAQHEGLANNVPWPSLVIPALLKDDRQTAKSWLRAALKSKAKGSIKKMWKPASSPSPAPKPSTPAPEKTVMNTSSTST